MRTLLIAIVGLVVAIPAAATAAAQWEVDFNGDGEIDGADYTIWADSLIAEGGPESTSGGGSGSDQPILTWSVTDIGSGLSSWDLHVDAQDGQLKSFYIDIEFSAPPGSLISQSQFHGVEVDDRADAILFDGTGDYQMSVDSFFDGDVWFAGPPLNGTVQTATTYAMSGGTGTQNYHAVAPLGQIVAPTSIDFTATISRDGANYFHTGVLVPEPTQTLLYACALATLALLRRRR